MNAAVPFTLRERTAAIARHRFDLVALMLGAWLVAGFYTDLWAHAHGKAESFFTPWHALLYGGLSANALFYGAVAARAVRDGVPLRASLPRGYGLSLAGVLVFAVAGFGDMLWHVAFGIEESVDALLSPTHLLLATGGILILGGPARAALAGAAPPFAGAVSLALALAVLAGFTQFASPAVHPLAERLPGAAMLSRQADLYSMRADGTAQTRLSTGGERDHWLPRLSPDGRRLAYSAGPARDLAASDYAMDTDRVDVYVANADGSFPRRLTDSGQNWLGGWSPDGRQLVFVSRAPAAERSRIFAINADGTDLRPVGDATLDAGLPTWSKTGLIAFNAFHGDGLDVYVMESDGANLRQLTTDAAHDFAPAWSPDGSRLAFTSERDGEADIYVMQADGTGQRRLTTDGDYDGWPAWSPDGTRIAFVSFRDWNGEIYVIAADGTGETNLSRNDSLDEGVLGVSWSADGTLHYTAQGRTPVWMDDTRPLGIASVLLQTALLAAMVLFAVVRGLAPLGALTLMVGLYGALLSVITDEFRLVPAAVIAGMLGDGLVARLRPSASRPLQLRLVAFAVPASYMALLLLTLQLGLGVGWSVHLAFGSIAVAGIVGLLLSLLVSGPPAAEART